MRVLFDTGHGQNHWAQTGFLPRTCSHSFSGVAKILSEMGFRCSSGAITAEHLKNSQILVIPPPTGQFNHKFSRWDRLESSLFSEEEIQRILQFIHGGGHLLAFSYRFGDSFTQTNMRELIGPLGCLLHESAVINLDSFLSEKHPLMVPFETNKECLPILGQGHVPCPVHWRSMTTLSILPGATASPLAVSPPRCVGFYQSSYRLIHDRQPIGVGGIYGNGRFAIFGGPHAFETGGYGLLPYNGNRKFVERVIHWLVSNKEPVPKDPFCLDLRSNRSCSSHVKDMWIQVSGSTSPHKRGELLVSFVDGIFQESGVLSGLGKSVWNQKRTSELDLIYRVSSQDPIWAETKGVVCVECKNWENPVGADEVGKFAEKIERLGGRIGFFAARTFTRQAWMLVEQVRLRRNTIIALLDDDDYQSLIDGLVSSKDLVESSLLRSMLL